MICPSPALVRDEESGGSLRDLHSDAISAPWRTHLPLRYADTAEKGVDVQTESHETLGGVSNIAAAGRDSWDGRGMRHPPSPLYEAPVGLLHPQTHTCYARGRFVVP